ncbi:endonuclease/exonuclease/phosphatase family protein [Psychroflexus aestuariivivens]|uniref:endonuclease/exonuclease/phosphatase family protein n=1 Tax=Psychroflexus aestuariivivens TaxID=1795040 RepID=UPI000FDBD91A|nr:endonuclease/exonuclease/phosphatase family protein [Psychroflexus aestuariivivens]
MKSLRFLLLVSIFFFEIAFAQVSLASWNIKDFGQSKSEEEIAFISETLKDFDIVAIQEVVAGPGGAKAVALLADALNRSGAKWDYAISNPTQSSPYRSERYAFLWKPSVVKLKKKAFLEQNYVKEIDREPFVAEFEYNKQSFFVFSMHALPKSKQPEKDLKYFKFFPKIYSEERLIFLGDFNLPSSHSVFNPLKSMLYLPIMENQKTSLRTKCIQGDCLASEYDHIFLKPSEIQVLDCGVIHFYLSFDDLKTARKISDHIPVWMRFSLN